MWALKAARGECIGDATEIVALRVACGRVVVGEALGVAAEGEVEGVGFRWHLSRGLYVLKKDIEML